MGGATCERRRGSRAVGAARPRGNGFALGLVATATVLSCSAAWSTFASAAASPAATTSALSIYLAGGSAMLLACLVVVVHATRTAHHVAGPEYRLTQSLRRLREGDLSFRISLRRGDLLTGLAAECNELIEWLNQNPPSGARIGNDVVDLEATVEVEEPTAVAEAQEVRP